MLKKGVRGSCCGRNDDAVRREEKGDDAGNAGGKYGQSGRKIRAEWERDTGKVGERYVLS
jgi:hypothetical protein